MRLVRGTARAGRLHLKTRVPSRVARRWACSPPSARSAGRRGRSQHRSGYSRSYLPHLDAADLVQGITFRLADSLPGDLLKRWHEEIRQSQEWPPGEARSEELRRRVAHYEDTGRGECHLRRPEIAALVRDALLRFDEERYRLLEWCVMPNHVHVLIRQMTGFPLAEIVRSWKLFTARQANAILGRSGQFWDAQSTTTDSSGTKKHLNQAVAYIRNNPVKAGLCERAQDWPWSSASSEGLG